jgi:hypothetical protein
MGMVLMAFGASLAAIQFSAPLYGAPKRTGLIAAGILVTIIGLVLDVSIHS